MDSPNPGRHRHVVAGTRMIRRLHRWNALALAAFLLLHLGNHVAVFAGFPAHQAAQDMIRPAYRALPAEALLLILFAAQITLGILLLTRRKGPRRGWRKLQALTGAYIAAFLILHVSAVLWARNTGVDTDIHFATGGMKAGFAWFFVPYYALAVAALIAHVAAALRQAWLIPAGALLGIALGVAMLAGV